MVRLKYLDFIVVWEEMEFGNLVTTFVNIITLVLDNVLLRPHSSQNLSSLFIHPCNLSAVSDKRRGSSANNRQFVVKEFTLAGEHALSLNTGDKYRSNNKTEYTSLLHTYSGCNMFSNKTVYFNNIHWYIVWEYILCSTWMKLSPTHIVNIYKYLGGGGGWIKLSFISF